jgi:23S rRNA G2445 N2-methylase RlmL
MRIASTQLIERRVRDAICDQIRDRTGVRPKPPYLHPRTAREESEEESDEYSIERNFDDNHSNKSNPKLFVEFPVFAIVHSNRLSLFRDLAGPSLHRRGYKSVIHKASLNETWAAGLLYEAEWLEKV